MISKTKNIPKGISKEKLFMSLKLSVYIYVYVSQVLLN